MHALQRRHLDRRSVRPMRQKDGPSAGGGERWGRHIALLGAGGGKARTQLGENNISGLVMMFCFDHPRKFSTTCGNFERNRNTNRQHTNANTSFFQPLKKFAAFFSTFTLLAHPSDRGRVNRGAPALVPTNFVQMKLISLMIRRPPHRRRPAPARLPVRPDCGRSFWPDKARCPRGRPSSPRYRLRKALSRRSCR